MIASPNSEHLTSVMLFIMRAMSPNDSSIRKSDSTEVPLIRYGGGIK